MRFVDLFAGLGGFHLALKELGHECVFASEIDPDLRGLYAKNFYRNQPHIAKKVVQGDVRISKYQIPDHEILCAGFPCQPFSKSGYQKGRRDRTRGTLFHEIIEVLRKHKPRYVIMENVGNFERHNAGRTWRIVRESLESLDYHVRGTTHVTSGGHGLISPHHLGFPHTRERFFIVASQDELPPAPFPRPDRRRVTSLEDIVQSNSDLSPEDKRETMLTRQQVECIDHWTRLLTRLPKSVEPPSFPIWGDEIGATYPYGDRTPFAHSASELRELVCRNGSLRDHSKRQLLALLPSYARTNERRFPEWKVAFIRQNREWFEKVARYTKREWVDRLREFPPSLRKLEWNCKGEDRDLWRHVLQFRPSGLRVKRYRSAPALVAMTTTQIPILGPKRRFLTRIEGLRLQGFPDNHLVPASRGQCFAALGNAVHVGVVQAIAGHLLSDFAPARGARSATQLTPNTRKRR